MAPQHRLERRSDGSVALFIGGDLQFDSRDEHVYHEVMALPALALAEDATEEPLTVLICGGGDGLALREVLKSPRVARVDLVDHDPEMLALAASELAGLNAGATRDPRASINACDARAWVKASAESGRRYDLILCDLTWPRTPDDATFHTTPWYEALSAILAPAGVLVLNAASPSATPEAFWAMVNGLRHVGLNVRPCRFGLPSFQARDYGPDWGFVLASRQTLGAEAFGESLRLAAPRRAIVDAAAVRRLFHFGSTHTALAATSAPFDGRPGAAASLLDLLERPGQSLPEGTDWDVLSAGLDAGTGPAPGAAPLVPSAVREALALVGPPEAGRDAVLDQVLVLLPGMHREPVRALVTSFLEAPARFLAALDLRDLVDRLLARAAELPARFVAEVRLLKDALADPSQVLGEAARAGTRVLAVVAVLVLVANMANPDTVFGKGAVGSHASFLHAGYGVHSFNEPPVAAVRGGFRNPLLGRGQAVDESGFLYPVRPYRIYRPSRIYYHGGPHVHGGAHRTTQQQGVGAGDTFGAPEELQVVYRLTPEVGLLSDGRLVMDLDDHAFFLLSAGALPLYDRDSGSTVLTIAAQPLLMWRIAQELDRQNRGLSLSLRQKQNWNHWMDWLDFLPGVDDDANEAMQIEAMQRRFRDAINQLHGVSTSLPPAAPPPLPGSAELFNGAWVLPSGDLLGIALEDGRWGYLDPARGWFADPQRGQRLERPYPPALKTLLARHLKQVVADEQANWTSLSRDLEDAQKDVASLEADEREYQNLYAANGNDDVDYGSESMPCSMALGLTRSNLATARQVLADLQAEQQRTPISYELYQRMLSTFQLAGAKP